MRRKLREIALGLMVGLCIASPFIMVSIVMSQASRDPLYGIEMPPPQYDFPNGLMTEVFLDLPELTRVCKGINRDERRYWGCALPSPQFCLAFVPRPLSAPYSFVELIRRHERAHCNGWRHE